MSDGRVGNKRTYSLEELNEWVEPIMAIGPQPLSDWYERAAREAATVHETEPDIRLDMAVWMCPQAEFAELGNTQARRNEQHPAGMPRCVLCQAGSLLYRLCGLRSADMVRQMLNNGEQGSAARYVAELCCAINDVRASLAIGDVLGNVSRDNPLFPVSWHDRVARLLEDGEPFQRGVFPGGDSEDLPVDFAEFLRVSDFNTRALRELGF